MLRIGILGGGQLARMLIEAGSRYGFEFSILSSEKDSPAGLITSKETIGNWNDKNAVSKFMNGCDIITLENEFIDYHILEFIEDAGKILLPGSECIRLIQDKLVQKQTLSEADIPVADFCGVESENDVLAFAGEFGYPVILKSRTMGYDGKGNTQIDKAEEVAQAVDLLSKRGKLMCERFINFDKEIATQAVRSSKGEVAVYPVVQTIQEDHICKFVIADRNGFAGIRGRVDEICRNILGAMNYAGLMGVEMFLCGEEIIVNELAPRVHNSGHYTIEACETSQFENHLRAIAGLPLGGTDMTTEAAVMMNLLGDRNGTTELKGIGDILRCRDTYLHIYGKKETRTGRKMGHLTLTGKDSCDLFRRAGEAGKILTI